MLLNYAAVPSSWDQYSNSTSMMSAIVQAIAGILTTKYIADNPLLTKAQAEEKFILYPAAGTAIETAPTVVFKSCSLNDITQDGTGNAALHQWALRFTTSTTYVNLAMGPSSYFSATTGVGTNVPFVPLTTRLNAAYATGNQVLVGVTDRGIYILFHEYSATNLPGYGYFNIQRPVDKISGASYVSHASPTLYAYNICSASSGMNSSVWGGLVQAHDGITEFSGPSIPVAIDSSVLAAVNTLLNPVTSNNLPSLMLDEDGGYILDLPAGFKVAGRYYIKSELDHLFIAPGASFNTDISLSMYGATRKYKLWLPYNTNSTNAKILYLAEGGGIISLPA